jgi:hypothetical protein
MKITRHPTKSGQDWWVLTHDLNISGSTLLRLRPIHVFTYLAQCLPGLGGKNKRIYNYCYALENKLFAVRYQNLELRKAIAEWNDIIYQDKYLRDYEDQQKVIGVLEAFLNSVYSALEITALINKAIYPQLRQSFSKQAEKDTFFSLSRWKWLCYFYDLRRELEHVGTSLPQMTNKSIMIEISRPGKKYALKEGRWEVPFSSILSFAIDLFEMLDQWASKELEMVDPETELISIFRRRLNEPLRHKKIKAKTILKLLKITEIKKESTGPGPKPPGSSLR